MKDAEAEACLREILARLEALESVKQLSEEQAAEDKRWREFEEAYQASKKPWNWRRPFCSPAWF